MVFGIGNDIIEIERIRSVIARHERNFLSRTFTEAEQRYCLGHKDPNRHFAGRFAAKEAVVKALGTGFRNGIGFLDIEILNDHNGKPYVRLSPRLEEMMKGMEILVSISHCDSYAAAFALVQRK